MRAIHSFSTFAAVTLAAGLAVPAAARAGQYDLKELTPEVQRSLEQRKARYEALRQAKREGAVGEDNQGFVKALKESPEAARLAQEENADRRLIYEAIVRQHGLGADGMAAVKAAFAEVQREKAKPNDAIQLPSGEWVTK